MKVLFFDPTAKAPYTMNTVRSYAMGASEASLMRVAAGLAALPGYEVSVFQVVDQSRRETVVDGVRHVNLHSKLEPDVIVHQRTARFVEDMAIEYPKARHIVWMHDLGHESWLKDELLNGVEVVCVSEFHRTQLLMAMPNGTGLPLPRFIYNPVVVDAERQPKVKGRLGFFSSPQKGLYQVIEAFRTARAANGNLELVIADPGYVKGPALAAEAGITHLGELSHRRCLEELSKCEALFYPQTVFPETMGVVLAEANAMGTPVLAHDFGAAREVLGSGCENVIGNMTNPKNVELLSVLLDGTRPAPKADPRFRIENVLTEWQRLLEGA